MAIYTYHGPVQVVPEMTAQDDIGGTLILRDGQSYAFPGPPPGDPALWAAAPRPAPKPAAAPAAPQDTSGG